MQKILDALKILDVYTCLAGCDPKRTNNNCYRGPATWRSGDGLNVSLDNDRGIWHDFATDEGGGILDLIVKIRGGSRRDALIWAAEFAGIPLESEEFTPEQKAEWAKAREALEKALPDALLWQRAAVNMAEGALAGLKARLFDSVPYEAKEKEFFLPFHTDDIYALERMLSRLRHLEGQRLVDEFDWWRERYPATTTAMIKAMRAQAIEEERTLRRYLRHEQARS